ILGTKDGFFRLSNDRRLSPLAHDNSIAPHSINEVIADPAGRIFGGQEVYKEGEPYETGHLFKIDLDGSLHVVDEGLHISNGMGFSLDQKTFYLIDSVPRAVYAYDYDESSGKISARRTLITLSVDDGLPDGMAVDSEGFLWIARW